MIGKAENETRMTRPRLLSWRTLARLLQILPSIPDPAFSKILALPAEDASGDVKRGFR
jgi:hypothetical protein